MTEKDTSLEDLPEEEYWFRGTTQEIKKYLADKITALFHPFTVFTFEDAEIPEPTDDDIYSFVEDQISKEIGVKETELETIQASMKNGRDGLRQLYETAEHCRQLTPEQRTEVCEYFTTFFKAHLLFFLSCYSFEKGTMTLGLLRKYGFGEKPWEKNVLQHCLATIVGMRGMGMGREGWSEDSEEGGVAMAGYATELMKGLNVTVDSLESLIPRVATGNGLFALSDKEKRRFDKFHIDMRVHVKKEGDKTSESIFKHFFPTKRQTGQFKGRCMYVYNAARDVLEKCKQTPLHYLYQAILMANFSDETGSWDFPGMGASPLERLRSLKLCSEYSYVQECGHAATLFANNWGKSVPASEEECMVCKLKLEMAPGPGTNLKFYPVIHANGFTGMIKQYDRKENEILGLVSRMIKNVNTLDETERLGPVELCLMRLLVYAAIYEKNGKVNQFQKFTETLDDDGNSSEINRTDFYAYQILVILTVLGNMLFPYVPIEVSISSVELFVVAVFGELARRLDGVRNQQVSEEELAKVSSLPLVEMMFGKAVATIIPSVFENLATIRMNAAKADAGSLVTARDPNNTVIWPMSTRHHLVPFLISPSLRKQYPVLYQFLHLSGQFSHVTLIDKIAPSLRKIRDYIMEAVSEFEWDIDWANAKLSDIADHLSTETKEAFNETLKALDKNSNYLWYAISATLNNVISNTCRSALKPFYDVQASGEFGDLPLRCFVPDQSDNWIFLQVLEGLSRSHNAFVRVLQTEVGIETSDIEDISMSSGAGRERMDLTPFGNMLIDCISGKISRSGIAVFDREIEESFAKVLSNQRYAIIVHTSLQAPISVRMSAAASDLVTHFDQVVRPRPLSWEQKYQLLKHAGRLSTNVSNMCERLMIKVLTLSRSSDKRCAGGQTIVEFIADQASQLSEFEKEGYFAFSKARNATQDSFVVAQLSRIYSLMKRTSDMSGADSVDTIDDWIVMSLEDRYGLSMDEPPARGFELLGNWDSICSLIPKMILALKGIWDADANKFFSMKIEDIVSEFEKLTRDPKGRLYLSADEREVLETMKRLRGPTGGHLFVFYDEARAKH